MTNWVVLLQCKQCSAAPLISRRPLAALTLNKRVVVVVAAALPFARYRCCYCWLQGSYYYTLLSIEECRVFLCHLCTKYQPPLLFVVCRGELWLELTLLCQLIMLYVALNSKIQSWQQDKFFENAFREDQRRRTKIRNIKTTVTVNRIWPAHGWSVKSPDGENSSILKNKL